MPSKSPGLKDKMCSEEVMTLNLAAVEDVLASPQKTALVFRDIVNGGVCDTAAKLIGRSLKGTIEDNRDMIEQIRVNRKAADELENAISSGHQLSAVRLSVAISAVIDNSKIASTASIKEWCRDSKEDYYTLPAYYRDD